MEIPATIETHHLVGLVGGLMMFFFQGEIKSIGRAAVMRFFGVAKKESGDNTFTCGFKGHSNQLIKIADMSEKMSISIDKGNDLKEEMLEKLCKDHDKLNQNIGEVLETVSDTNEHITGNRFKKLEREKTKP